MLPLKKRGSPIRRESQEGAEAAGQAPLMLNIFTHQPYGAMIPHFGSASQLPRPTQVDTGAVRRASLSLSGSESSWSPAATVLPSHQSALRGALGVSAAVFSGSAAAGQAGKPAPALKHRQKTGASSAFRGVTRHSTTGRFEAHLWDSSSIRPKSVRSLDLWVLRGPQTLNPGGAML